MKNINKKTNHRIRMIPIKEWYAKIGGKVYLNWEFSDGKRIKRLIPYDDFPYVEINWSNKSI
jgi:hypothetical protein